MVENLRNLVLDVKSAYNQATNSAKLQSLCLPLVDERPIVVLKTNKASKLIQNALFVVCKTEDSYAIFHLDNKGGVEVNF